MTKPNIRLPSRVTAANKELNMDKKTSCECSVYKITALFIFVILVIFIVLITVSTVLSKNDVVDVDFPPQEAGESAHENDLSEPVDSSYVAGIPETSNPAAIIGSPSVTDTSTLIKAPDTISDTQSTETLETAPLAPIPGKDSQESVTPPSNNIPEELSAFLSEYPDTVLTVTKDAGKEYIDKLTFLGDSTTYGLRFYEMLEGGKETLQVWTPKSGTLTLTNASFATVLYPETGDPITIKEAVLQKKPEYLVITLGVNGISFMSEDYFKSEYKKIIESVKEASPDTKIICQSMFPVARTYKKLESINNEKIREGNRWIVEVAAETGVKFIDTYSALADSEGWLPENYHNGDGMHLCAESFTIELNNLRTHAYE